MNNYSTQIELKILGIRWKERGVIFLDANKQDIN